MSWEVEKTLWAACLSWTSAEARIEEYQWKLSDISTTEEVFTVLELIFKYIKF